MLRHERRRLVREMMAAHDATQNKAEEVRPAFQWRAAKLAPKKYGDKVEQTHVGPDGGPILIATGVVCAGE
jgi:hypothetical protein